MGLDEHLDAGDKVEEEGQAGQMDTGLAPADQPVKDGRKNGDRSRRIEDHRNSQPEQIHFASHLTGAKKQYTVTLITCAGWMGLTEGWTE